MNIPLNPHQENVINQKIESGLYASPDEVIDATLRLLDERDRKLEALWRDIEEGLSIGLGSTFYESGVRDIKKRGREHLGWR
jgi:antitoxin ParD1/3/4